jgi:hypothetical membrane protein
MALMNRRITRQLSLAGIIGPILFTCLVVVQGILQPDYSHVRLPVSALAAWPAGWIQVLNFYIFGSLTIAFAVALHGAMQHSTGMAGVGLLALSGVGLMLAGTFSWEMVEGVPTETPPHVVGAIVSFVGTGAGYVALSRRMATDAEWRDLTTHTRITGAAILLLFVVLGAFAIDEKAPLHPWAGLLQRVVCVVWFTCMIVLALRVRRIIDERRNG